MYSELENFSLHLAGSIACGISERRDIFTTDLLAKLLHDVISVRKFISKQKLNATGNCRVPVTFIS